MVRARECDVIGFGVGAAQGGRQGSPEGEAIELKRNRLFEVRNGKEDMLVNVVVAVARIANVEEHGSGGRGMSGRWWLRESEGGIWADD